MLNVTTLHAKKMNLHAPKLSLILFYNYDALETEKWHFLSIQISRKGTLLLGHLKKDARQR